MAQDLDVDAADAKDKQMRLRQIISVTMIPLSIYESHKEEIHHIMDVLNSQTDHKQKWEAQRKLQDFTLSIEPYVWRKLGKEKFKISIRKREDIYVMDCVYDRAGFHPIKAKQQNTGIFW